MSSKSSSMIDLPSSMMPAIPSQCLPRTFSSRLSNTCSRRSIWPCVSSRCDSKASRRMGSRRPSPTSQRLGQLFLGVVRVAQFVDERIVERACFSHVESPLVSVHVSSGAAEMARRGAIPGVAARLSIWRWRRALCVPGQRLAINLLRGERPDGGGRSESPPCMSIGHVAAINDRSAD